jgi:exopolyphosphatase/pppGpp-phosphohydrolase
MHDRLAPADPPDSGELLAVATVVTEQLDALTLPLPVGLAVACGGSATTLAALARRALGSCTAPGGAGAAEEPRALPELTNARLQALTGLLQQSPATEISARYGADSDRARLLGAGAVILRAVLRRLAVGHLLVSRRGIREGAMLAFARHGANWLAAAAQG